MAVLYLNSIGNINQCFTVNICLHLPEFNGLKSIIDSLFMNFDKYKSICSTRFTSKFLLKCFLQYY